MSDTVTNETPSTNEPSATNGQPLPDDTDVLFRDDADDIDEEMPTRAKRRIVTAWTMVFAALVIAGAGFVAGIQMEKRNAPAASGLPPGLAAFANARANGGAFPGAFTGRGNAANGATGASSGAGGNGATQTPAGNGATGRGTTGTVKLVDGTNVYITTADGSIVKVTTSPTSKVTKASPGAVSDLKAGDTVTVQGTTGADGTIAASSISQGP